MVLERMERESFRQFQECAAAVAIRPCCKDQHRSSAVLPLPLGLSYRRPPLGGTPQWLKTRFMALSTEMAQLKRHEDRMAVCSYTLTGDVLGEGQKAEVGSLAMWSVPQGSPLWSTSSKEHFFKSEYTKGDVRVVDFEIPPFNPSADRAVGSA